MVKVKKQLKSVLINNYSQSYKNEYWTLKDGKLVKKKQKNGKLPHYYTKRPYKDSEIKNIMRKVGKMKEIDKDRVALMEKLDMQKFIMSSDYTERKSPIVKQLNENFPKTKREIFRRIFFKYVKERKMVIYGGFAINEYLTDDLKIYSKDTMFNPSLIDNSSIFSDVDVYSKSPKRDIIELAHILKKRGYKYIEVKPGMNKGTWKLFVSFINVCDFTKPEQGIPYKTIKGIRYASIDYLRAQLYKILSDPTGDVSIWPKTMNRLERLEHSIKVNVDKNPNIVYDNKSKYQRFITNYYGPKSKARKSEKMKMMWNKKEKVNSLKKKYNVKNLNISKINLKNANKIEVLKKGGVNNNVPWGKNMKGLRLK